MEKITIKFNGLDFAAEYSETQTVKAGKNVTDKTVLIAKDDQSSAQFTSVGKDKRFYFESTAIGNDDFYLTEEVPQHYIFTNKPL